MGSVRFRTENMHLLSAPYGLLAALASRSGFEPLLLP